jgi:pSer/pThr/pTyr-binding forkhead associated (FHA) protein
LVEGPATIGRSEDCDIFLVDPSVSRTHAMLEIQGDALFVKDNGSTNGTFVNGERVEAGRVVSGDVIAFGNTEMRLEGHD